MGSNPVEATNITKIKGMKKEEISWEAPEFNEVERGIGWYFLIGIISLALFLFGWFTKNFFFMVFVIIAAVLLIALGRRKPERITFTLHENGIRVGNVKTPYPYSSFRGFAIVEHEHGNNVLILRQKSFPNQYLKIPLPKIMTLKVRNFLKEKLTENSYEESFMDILSDRMGF